MQKKQYFSMALLIFLALLIGAAILISKPSENKIQHEINSKSVNAFGSSQEKNLSASIINGKDGLPALKFKYNKNGCIYTDTIDSKTISEINYQSKIRSILINNNYEKLYFLIENEKKDKSIQTVLYSYDLNNSKTEKIFDIQGN